MQLSVIAVGRLRPALREVADEYLRRLSRFWPVREQQVREAGKAPSAAVRRRDEGRRLLDALGPFDWPVALDREGRAWTSEDLARELGRWRDQGRNPAFLIGGADGLSRDVLDAARGRWSLGPLTLPHELARVVMLEQLYRGGTILAGQPYHRQREPR